MEEQVRFTTELDHAEWVVSSLGFVPIPLKGKIPKTLKWEDTTKENWMNNFQSCPDYNNVGIVCGEASGIIVVDVDVKDDGLKWWKENIRENLDHTFHVETGSGGRHYYLKYDPENEIITSLTNGTKIVQENGKKFGIDLKTNKGQVVAPWSIHPDTKKYYVPLDKRGEIWNGDKPKIIHFPMWLYKKFTFKSKMGKPYQNRVKSVGTTSYDDDDQELLGPIPLPSMFNNNDSRRIEYPSSFPSIKEILTYWELIDNFPTWNEDPKDPYGYILYRAKDEKGDLIPSFCDICGHQHESQNQKIYFTKSGEVYLRCFQDHENRDFLLYPYPNQDPPSSIHKHDTNDRDGGTPAETYLSKMEEPHPRKLNFYDGTMYYGDVYTKFANKLVISHQEVINQLEKVAAYCISEQLFVWKGSYQAPLMMGKSISVFSYYTKPKKEDTHTEPSNQDNSKKTKMGEPQPKKTKAPKNEKHTSDTLLKNSICYNALIFQPYSPIQTPPQNNDFNLWQGFRAQVVDKVDESKISLILNHIKEVWAGGNEECYRWILSWYAHIIQKPNVKTQKCLTLVSEQGAGKNVISDFIEEFVIGQLHAITICGLDKITSRFNAIREGMLMIVLNEVDACEGFKSAFVKMKSLITEKRQEIERKGIDPTLILDCTNYVILSNDRFSVYVEDGDRRYMMPDVSDKFKGNTDYFDNLRATLTQDTANHLFTFLLNYQGINVIDEKNIPTTETKRSMLANSISSAIAFGKAFKSGDLNIDDLMTEVNNDRNRQNKPLLEYYTKPECYDTNNRKICAYTPKDATLELYFYYCSKIKRRPLAKEKFYTDILKEFTTTRPRVNGQRPYCYIIPIFYPDGIADDADQDNFQTFIPNSINPRSTDAFFQHDTFNPPLPEYKNLLGDDDN